MKNWIKELVTKFDLDIIWILTFIVFGLVSVIVGCLASIFLSLGASIGIGILVLVILSIKLFTDALVSVPETVNAISAVFGKYSNTLEPGAHLIYPWFNVETLPKSFAVAEHSIDIFTGGGGEDMLIEFKQSAAKAKCAARMKVVNPKKAFTAVVNPYMEIRDIFRKLFRDYAENSDLTHLTPGSDVTAAQAQQNREKVNLNTLFKEEGDEEAFKNSTLWKHIFDDWGIEILSFRLEDIILTEEDRKARAAVFAAQRKLEQTELESQAKERISRADAYKITVEGRAVSDAIKQKTSGLRAMMKALITAGASNTDAAQIIQSDIQWTAVTEVEKPLLNLSSNNSVPTIGAQLGAGSILGKEVSAKE